MIFEFLVLLLALVIGWNAYEKRVRNFPPGPMRLPLLGHLPQLGKHPWKTLCQWKSTYGPVIGIWFGSYRAVAIHDAKLIREAMNMSVAAGRPQLNLFASMTHDGIQRGIATSSGSQWIEQRRFAIKNLRNFGIGTKTMEFKIQEEISELLNTLRAKEGQAIQAKGLFNGAVLNALWSILFGERMKDTDPDSVKAFQGLTSVFDSSNLATLAYFMPWIAKIAPRLSGFEKVTEGLAAIRGFLRKQIEVHSAEYVQNQPRDFVDAYTDEVRKTTDLSSSFHPKNDFMVYVLVDLFSGGTETTSITLSWFCAYMIHYTQVQKKLQDEIDWIVGKERVPSLADRSSMPYTEAVINEVMRFSIMFPFAMVHNAAEDFEFHGYFIPKDTMILPNVYGVHFDREIWGDPENFRPERFIDSNGKFKRSDNNLPFSTGKRVCLGEGLGRDQLFLFTTNLFQMFNATAAGELPSLEPHVGISLAPQPFEMVLKSRME